MTPEDLVGTELRWFELSDGYPEVIARVIRAWRVGDDHVRVLTDVGKHKLLRWPMVSTSVGLMTVADDDPDGSTADEGH